MVLLAIFDEACAVFFAMAAAKVGSCYMLPVAFEVQYVFVLVHRLKALLVI